VKSCANCCFRETSSQPESSSSGAGTAYKYFSLISCSFLLLVFFGGAKKKMRGIFTSTAVSPPPNLTLSRVLRRLVVVVFSCSSSKDELDFGTIAIIRQEALYKYRPGAHRDVVVSSWRWVFCCCLAHLRFRHIHTHPYTHHLFYRQLSPPCFCCSSQRLFLDIARPFCLSISRSPLTPAPPPSSEQVQVRFPACSKDQHPSNLSQGCCHAASLRKSVQLYHPCV
jgi:hypothetical protein